MLYFGNQSPQNFVINDVPSRCLTFDFSNYYKQDFSLSNSIIYYITKSPTNAKAYQKLIQTCKYFFNKNSMIVLRCLHYIKIKSSVFPYFKHDWVTCMTDECDETIHHRRNSFMKDTLCLSRLPNVRKLWIAGKIDMIICFSNHWYLKRKMEASYSSLLINLIPKLYRCDAVECYLYYQTLNFDQFLFFTSKTKKCDLCSMTIKDAKNGHEIPLETITANLIHLEEFQFDVNYDCTNITSNTAEHLLKIPHFSNIKILWLYDVPKSFNYHSLEEYAKMQKGVVFKFKHPREKGISPLNQLDELRIHSRSIILEWIKKQMKI